ncbi:NAD(P)H-hydrate dehydratase [Chitinolyticbacter albus]|uniref:NAD(P)H-hydrate dehydratase n=1 Tax=Chitinolyticbacter albus TaxID=2961951 RepID=UPI002109D04D|nr:NAD(P)H-hydrate dehydratase [Chitinolyticbacter albus]
MACALFSSRTLRTLEALHATAQPPLMQRAGAAIAAWIQDHFPLQPLTVVAGPGNNGGDALIAASQLRSAGWPVRVHRLGSCRHPELEQGLDVVETPPTGNGGLLLDGLFGIGLQHAPRSPADNWIAAINRSQALIVAIDVPSGLDADTGHAPGVAVRAAHTLTLLGNKPGLYTGMGRDLAGKVSFLELGVTLPDSPDYLLIEGGNAPRLAPRIHASHKGSFGSVVVIGGARGMAGAALLAGRAALHAGAGKVHVGLLDDALHLDPQQPELMLNSARHTLEAPSDAIAIGPGLGRSAEALQMLALTLAATKVVVLDADALNLVAETPSLGQQLQQRQYPTIITPHPAEAARLLGCDTAAIQDNRFAAVARLRDHYRCTVVLKGSGTLCTSPEQLTSVNGSGNGALASAGQGDVLTGLISAICAQGLVPLDAARLATWAHGAVADHWRDQHPAGVGLTAAETLGLARTYLNR